MSMWICVRTFRADAGVDHVRDDVDEGDSVLEGTAEGLAKERAPLDVPDDVLDALPVV